MSRYAKIPKPRTAADRRSDLIQFLGFARPEKVAVETPDTLATRFGVTVDVATQALNQFGRML